MTTDYTTKGGHKVRATGRTMKGHPGTPREWECTGCETRGDSLVFTVGLEGCPADPTSFPLWVCPGGDRCEGHPDTDSAEFRSWREIPSFPNESVPRLYCAAEDFAKRAADRYRERADRLGLRMSAWSQSGYKVGPEGGKVAELTFIGLSWSVWVDASGKVTARVGTE